MDYGFYKTNFGGTLIPPEFFPRFYLKAECLFKSLTLNREVSEDEEKKIPFILCEMAELLFSRRNCPENDKTDTILHLRRIAQSYLGNSALFYSGN